MTMTATLLQSLRQFPAPDTATPAVGTLAEGTYEVFTTAIRGTDEYALVGTWICTKSRGTTYATLSTPVAPVTDGIDEVSLTTVLQRFRGFVYSGGSPRYTGPLPNVSVPIAPPRQDNCCTFAEDLVVHAFEAAHFPFLWDEVRHSQLMVGDWSDLWSPPHGVADAGLARAVQGPATTSPLPPPWTLCQGWGPSSGHTFLVLAVHAPTGKVLILESNSAFGFSGPGIRGLGGLDAILDAGGPPADWWTKPEVPTWTEMHERYTTGIAQAQLKVNTASLVWGRSS